MRKDKQHQRCRRWLNIVMSMNKGKEAQALQFMSNKGYSHGIRKEASKMLKERAQEATVKV